MQRGILYVLLLLTLKSFSQEEYVKLPGAKTQKETYLYNSSIIGSKIAIAEHGSSKDELKKIINQVSVLKDKQNRKLNTYYNLTEYGMVFIDLTKEISSKTQAELNTFFGFNEQTDIYVDGYLVENKNFDICLTGISDIEIIQPNAENKLKGQVLNIWTLKKKDRYRK